MCLILPLKLGGGSLKFQFLTCDLTATDLAWLVTVCLPARMSMFANLLRNARICRLAWSRFQGVAAASRSAAGVVSIAIFGTGTALCATEQAVRSSDLQKEKDAGSQLIDWAEATILPAMGPLSIGSVMVRVCERGELCFVRRLKA